jgi:hypothetical protein
MWAVAIDATNVISPMLAAAIVVMRFLSRVTGEA